MEKTLRVLGGGEEGEGGHAHGHSHSHAAPIDAHASGVDTAPLTNGLKSRKSQKAGDDGKKEKEEAQAEAKAAHSSKLSAYLNLFGDFVHNM